MERAGLLARPDDRPRGQGMAALWVDAAAVGVPSDFYYLAAERSLDTLLPRRADCEALRVRVLVDRAPGFAGGADSPGDYIADGRGRCTDGDAVLRWGYFVVAPGFGPARTVGIPASGLYVVVAIVREAPHARADLRRMLGGVGFNGAGMAEFLAAAGG
ncbi:MAG: hypothetical protein ACKO8G_03205 [Actinomycetota bacterium]